MSKKQSLKSVNFSLETLAEHIGAIVKFKKKSDVDEVFNLKADLKTLSAVLDDGLKTGLDNNDNLLKGEHVEFERIEVAQSEYLNENMLKEVAPLEYEKLQTLKKALDDKVQELMKNPDFVGYKGATSRIINRAI